MSVFVPPSIPSCQKSVFTAPAFFAASVSKSMYFLTSSLCGIVTAAPSKFGRNSCFIQVSRFSGLMSIASNSASISRSINPAS